MPKSKRSQVVSLTQVKKKGMQQKEKLVDEIRGAVGNFENIFLFNVANMRNNKFKEMRQTWIGSRFFMGKNKVMAVALGVTPETEQKKDLHLLTQRISGPCGLLMTNRSVEDVVKFFDEYEETNFARSGFVSTVDFGLKKGLLLNQPFPMEPQLRKLGLPTRLKDGNIELLQDTQICKKGDTLTPDQCKLLELFGQEIAVMKVILLGAYNTKEEKYTELCKDDEAEDDGEERKGAGAGAGRRSARVRAGDDGDRLSDMEDEDE